MGMQLEFHTETIEDLIAENHFLRKLEAMLDLTFMYEETAHLYSTFYNRKSYILVLISRLKCSF